MTSDLTALSDLYLHSYDVQRRVGWGMEPPCGNKPLVLRQFYVFEICVWWTNTMLPPIDYSDEKTDAGKKRGKEIFCISHDA